MKKATLVGALIFLNSLFVSSLSASEVAQQGLSVKQVRLIVDQVLTVLDQSYVYPKAAEKMRSVVMSKAMSGAYDNALSKKVLIERLQIDFRKVSRDRHISLHLAKQSVDRTAHARPLGNSDHDVYSSIAYENGSREIGYLRLNTFSGDSKTKSQLSDAMRSLDSSDALSLTCAKTLAATTWIANKKL